MLDSGARMSVSDGTLTVVAKNQAVMDKVQEKVLVSYVPHVRNISLI